MTVQHDPGLAASPRLWHKLEVERDGSRAPLLAPCVPPSRTNKNAPRTTASETATRMNAERVVLDPRIEGGAIEDLGGGGVRCRVAECDDLLLAQRYFH
jgi:hypothetical protein